MAKGTRALFQHRHYVKLADIISTMPEDIRPRIALLMAAELRGTNPKFDATRFYGAAMGKPVNGRDGKKKTERTVIFNMPRFDGIDYPAWALKTGASAAYIDGDNLVFKGTESAIKQFRTEAGLD